MNSDNWRVKREPSETPVKDQSPRTPVQQRGWGTRGRGSGFEQRSSPRSFQQGPQTPSRDGFRKPINDAQAEQAIEEGRRLYVGNMPYHATTKDVEKLFEDVLNGVQAINIAVDPMTGRNPSYCFVDFTTKEMAERVMDEYDGRDFMRRPLKVKPGVRSGNLTGRRDERSESGSNDSPFLKNRWNSVDKPEDRQKAAEEGRRLYIGGLPRFENYEDTNQKIRSLLAGFNVEVVSKLVSAHESTRDMPGNHNYCFVDLASPGETDAAIKALNGKEVWDWHIRVNHSFGASGKLAEKRRLFVGGLPEFGDQDAVEAGVKELLEGFEISKVSKLFLPRETGEEREGHHCYCFVELANEDQTEKAILELDWKEKWGGKVRVKPATSNPKGGNRTGNSAAYGWGMKQERD